MSMSARDKKIVMVLLPVLLTAGFWFLVLSPKGQEAAAAKAELSTQKDRRDAAVARVGALSTAQASFASDYAAVVRLGKAIPPTLDLPSLIVQLDRASRGTGIDFATIRTGDQEGGSGSSPSSGAGSSGGSSSASSSSGSGASSGSSSPPAAAGGAAAKSGPGKATEQAGNAKGSADASSSATNSASGSPPSSSGGTSGAGSTPSAGGDSSAAGLNAVPVEFEFKASYFDLADFLHRMKRFVYVADERVRVRGRLMTIDSIKYTQDGGSRLKAEIKATVYLTPKPEGPTAGASPQGPAGAASSAPPQSAASSPSSPPTATVAP